MTDQNLLEDQPIAWTPTPDVIERAQLTKFMRQVGVSTWNELYAFSINDVEKFTEEVLKFLDIRFDPPYDKLLDTSNGVEFPTWFARSTDTPVRTDAAAASETVSPTVSPSTSDISRNDDLAGGSGDADKSVRAPSAGLNITEMCLDRWQTDEMKDQPAVIWEGEKTYLEESITLGETTFHKGEESFWFNAHSEILTYRDLFQRVNYCAAGLRKNGLGKGDAIAIHLPMIPETVIALLAIGRIGAIAVPVFSGYGVSAIESRLNAVQAKAIFTCAGFPRRHKYVKAFETALAALKMAPDIRKVFVVSRYGDIEDSYFEFDNDIYYDFEYLIWEQGEPNFEKYSFAEPTSAEDPLIILYTSGTTGKPKGIAHTHASFPIKAAQDMAFGTDVDRGTRISWYTDIGWMMGPWLIYGALINGATICIYDGAPDYPTPDRMWEFCAKHKVEVLGISPTLVRSLASHEPENSPPYEGGVAPASGDGVVLSSDNTVVVDNAESHPTAKAAPLLRKEGSRKAPFERHDLSSLRMFASTGEPWNPAPWWWLFEMVGNSKLPIINYSGGTEIAGGILMGNPLLPIKPCSFPAPCPGMDVDILDEDGNPVGPGKVGELVIKQPWIGMARGFWQENERYLDTYWRRFKDIWVHGDFAMRDKDGHWFILGRSDDTLKVAGKRVGPSEVESILVSHPAVVEAAVIGVPDETKGTAMVAFCVLRDLSPQRRRDAEINEDTAIPDSQEGGLAPADSEIEELKSELKALVAKDMGKPLAPSKIHFVSALPKTRNAKVMRRVLRSAYLGEDPGDLSALENPQAVEEIRRSNQ